MMLNLGRRLNKFSEDRGSVVIMTVANLLFFTVFGFVTIDVGLFMNERRDAQSDVDRIALAGALELTLNVDPAAQANDTAAALAAADVWADRNGVDPADPAFISYESVVVSDCFSADDGLPTGVTATVERVPLSFFITLFGIVDWNVSATATACAGRPIELSGFLPFALSQSSDCFQDAVDGNGNPIRVPRLGERCDIDIDTNTTGNAGELSFEPDSSDCVPQSSSANDLKDNIIDGVTTKCQIGDIIGANTGHNVGPTKTGIQDRLLTDGMCSLNPNNPTVNSFNFSDGNAALNAILSIGLPPPVVLGDEFDDFYEVWAWDPANFDYPNTPHPASGLVPYDCDLATPKLQTSPRNVSLIVIGSFDVEDGGVNQYIIKDFARMYLEGCSDKDGEFHKDCDVGGGKFTIHARFIEQVVNTQADLGLEASFGEIAIFLKH